MEKDKVRLSRTTRKQYEELLEFLEKNSIILKGKNKPSEAQAIKELWGSFTTEINSKNIGPCKSVDQWKRILTEWKVNTKRKSRDILLHQQGTGGGVPTKKKLSDLEERLLSLTSKIHLGDDMLPDSLGGHNTMEEPNSYVVALEPLAENTIQFEVMDGIIDETNEVSVDPPVVPEPRKPNKEGKGRADRYTSRILKEACEHFSKGQEAIVKGAVEQAESLQDLTAAVWNVGQVLEERNKILENIAVSKAVKAEASLISARAQQMQTEMKMLKLKYVVND